MQTQAGTTSNPTDLGATPGAAQPAETPGALPGVFDEIKQLWQHLRTLTYDHLRLAVLETKLAAETLVTMVAMSVMIAILLVSAWLGLIGAAAMLLIEKGMHPSLALLIITLLNLAIAFGIALVIKRQRKHLMWSSTVRTLRPAPHISGPQPGSEQQP